MDGMGVAPNRWPAAWPPSGSTAPAAGQARAAARRAHRRRVRRLARHERCGGRSAACGGYRLTGNAALSDDAARDDVGAARGFNRSAPNMAATLAPRGSHWRLGLTIQLGSSLARLAICGRNLRGAALLQRRTKFRTRIHRGLDLAQHRVAFRADLGPFPIDRAPMRSEMSKAQGGKFRGECRTRL